MRVATSETFRTEMLTVEIFHRATILIVDGHIGVVEANTPGDVLESFELASSSCEHAAVCGNHVRLHFEPKALLAGA